MRNLADQYSGPAFEVGPGKVLTGLMKRIVPDSPVTPLGEIAGFEKALESQR